MGRVLLRSGVSEARERIEMVWSASCDLSPRWAPTGEARRGDTTHDQSYSSICGSSISGEWDGH